MANIGYRRVSTNDQNPERQLDGVAVDDIFTDFVSGKNTDRPELQSMLRFVRRGDTLHVHSLDRLSRNLSDLCRLVSELVERGVEVHFLKENLVFNGAATPMSNLMLHLMGAFAEFEREIIRERQREGIEKAKAAGKYKGRKPSLAREQVIAAAADIERGIPLAAVARKLHVGRTTLYRYLDDLKKENPQPSPEGGLSLGT